MSTSEQKSTELHMDDEHDRRQAKPEGTDMLKAASTIIGGLILALVLWLGKSVQETTIQMVEMKIRLDQVFDAQQRNSVASQVLLSSLKDDVSTSVGRVDGHLDSIWPRLRELKARTQVLESDSTNRRVAEPWKY